MDAHRCSTAAQNAAFSGFWQEAVQKHMEAAVLFEEAAVHHQDEQVAKGMRLLATSERKKAQEMVRQVEMARAVTPPRTGPGPSRLGGGGTGASAWGTDTASMPARSTREERRHEPTVLKGVVAKPSPAGPGLDTPMSIDRATLVSPEAVAVATSLQAAAAEAGTSASAAGMPVATDSFSWDRFWVVVEELLEILPKPLFDGQDDADDVLGGLEEDFIAIRKSSSISLPCVREELDGGIPVCDTSPEERHTRSPSTTEDAGFFVVPSPRQHPAGGGLKNSSSIELPTVRVFLDEADGADGAMASRIIDDDEDDATPPRKESAMASSRLVTENKRLRQETERLRQELRQERRVVAELSQKHDAQQRANDNLTKRILLFRRELKARVDELHLFAAPQAPQVQPHTASCKEEMVIARGAPRILQMEVTIAEQAEQIEKQKEYISQLEKRWRAVQEKAKRRKSSNQSFASSSLSSSEGVDRAIAQPAPRHVRNPSIEQLLDQ